MKTKNKIIFIILAFVFILLFNSNVFGFEKNSTYTFEVPCNYNSIPSVPDSYDVTINCDIPSYFSDNYMWINPSNLIYIFNKDTTYLKIFESGDWYRFVPYDKDNNILNFFAINYHSGDGFVTDDCPSLSKSCWNSSDVGYKNGEKVLNFNDNFFALCSFPIYDSSGDLVFQGPPRVLTLEEVTQEAHQMAKEITAESLGAELEKLIPVGVLIMGALVTVSLVAYFRFWRV